MNGSRRWHPRARQRLKQGRGYPAYGAASTPTSAATSACTSNSIWGGQGVPVRKRTSRAREVRLYIGTRKGGFVFHSDLKRKSWRAAGPHFAGWEVRLD